MPQKTIPDLNPTSILEDNYAFPVDSGIQTYKVIWSKVKEFMWNNVIDTFTALTTPGPTDLIGVELGSGINAGKIRKVALSDLKSFISENAGIPIGGVIGFFDFNGLLSYDSEVFALINGQTISDGDSPLDGIVLPNATGRALLGYGTDGGSDQASAPWSVSPVGNTGHVVNISHSHVLGNQSYAKIHLNTAYLGTKTFSSPQAWSTSEHAGNLGFVDATPGWTSTVTTVGIGSSVIALGGSTDAGGNSALDIRMRSIRVRWLMRYK